MAVENVWVTSAQDEGSARDALLLGCSLRRVITTGKLLVTVGNNVTQERRNALANVFDACVDKEIENCLPFSKLLRLEADWIAIRNPDSIFDQENVEIHGLVLGKGCSTEELAYFATKSAVNRQPSLVEYRKEIDEVVEQISSGQPIPAAFSYKPTNTPIAIVGMSYRFPGCLEKSDFWKLLMDGKCTVGLPPDHRYPKETFPESGEEFRFPAAYVEKPLEEFDSQFFGMSPFEAELSDPQLRFMLEVTWEALEDAGIPPASLKGKNVGVFAASWAMYHRETVAAKRPEISYIRSYLANGFGPVAGKISHILETTGPVVALEAGCAGVSVAIGQAMKALRNREVEMAIVATANLITKPTTTNDLKGLTAPDGWCKTFDKSANGFGRGEGCGVIILKRLPEASAANDRMHALLLGYGQSQEGLSTSMGTPTVDGEALSMSRAVENANIPPACISYVEAHGTGTAVGDPIEISAMAKVYSKSRKEPLVVASVKPNVGHLEGSSGMAGLIKIVLSMQNDVIPPHIGCKELNPKINLGAVPAVIPMEPFVWKKKSTSDWRVGGVSSFGISGTDTHIIVGEAPQWPKVTAPSKLKRHLLPVSAKSEESFNSLLQNYEEYLATANEQDLQDICYTASAGRSHLKPYRAVVEGSTAAQMLENIQNEMVTKEEKVPQVTPKVCFIFAGQGSHYKGMGKRLYDVFPVFRDSMDDCFRILKGEGVDMKEIMWGDLEDKVMAHIGTVCLAYALTNLWESWGVEAEMHLGHSLGEIIGYLVSGMVDLEDILKFVVKRAVIAAEHLKGQMIAIKADEDTAQRLMTETLKQHPSSWLDITCYNSKMQHVIGGPSEVIPTFLKVCEANGVKNAMVNPDTAVHARHVENIKTQLLDVLKGVEFRPGNCDVIGCTTGEVVKVGSAIALFDLVRNPVRFVQSCKIPYERGVRHFLEMSAHPIISAMVRDNTPEKVTCVPSMRRNKDDVETVLEALSTLYLAGVDVNWDAFYAPFRGNRVSIPTYPFLKKRHVLEPTVTNDGADSAGSVHPLVGPLVETPKGQGIFRTRLNLKSDKLKYLQDHIIGGMLLYPGAAFAETCIAAGYLLNEGGAPDGVAPQTPLCLQNWNVSRALLLDPAKVTELNVMVEDGEEDDTKDISVYRKVNGHSWIRHSKGTFSNAAPHKFPKGLPNLQDTNEWTKQDFELYPTWDTLGYNFGPTFQSMRYQWVRKDNSQMVIQIPDVPDATGYILHPILIDAVIQAAIAARSVMDGKTLTRLAVPVSIGRLTWYPSPQKAPYYAVMDKGGEVRVLDAEGHVFMETDGVRLAETDIATLKAVISANDVTLPDLYEEKWVTTEVPVSGPTVNPSKGTWFILREKDTPVTAELQKLLQSSTKEVTYATHVNSNLPPNLEGIVFAYGLDSTSSQETISKNFLTLSQRLLKLKLPLPKLIVPAIGSVYVEDQEPLEPTGGTLRGLTKNLWTECPEVEGKWIDLCPESSAEEQAKLLHQEMLLSNFAERQIAYRQGKRVVLRLQTMKASPPTLPLPKSSAFSVQHPATKSISDLKLAPFPREKELLPNRVEVQVLAGALNFKDILNVIKPDAQFEGSGVLGSDISGVVTKVGSAVTKFKVGDPVYGMNYMDAVFPSHVVLPEGAVARLPDGLTHEEAATLPLGFATAYYCMVDVAKLLKGENVLIHTASGGVGLSAIQIANKLGAEIYATAGSRRKRAYLRRVLGLKNVYDSRSLKFGEQIMRDTQGAGIQLVLNTLTSPGFKETSLSCCSKGNSRFIEISKLNVWNEADVRAIRSDVFYKIVSLHDFPDAEMARVVGAMDQWVTDGSLKPIPYTRFGITDISGAMGFFQKTKQVGKVVLAYPRTNTEVSLPLFNERSSYLITGGLGGIGLKLAEFMVSQGARSLILVGRSAPNEEAGKVITKLQGKGVTVTTLQADVATSEGLVKLRTCLTTLKPLRGIMHAAGVLRDGMLPNQTWEKFEACYHPKINGAWNLHQFSIQEDLRLEHFVSFSSIASIAGLLGQSNYVAANAYLDTFTQYRIALGLPALTVNWGLWGDVGMGTGVGGIRNISAFSSAEGIAALEYLLRNNKEQAIVVKANMSGLATDVTWRQSYFQLLLKAESSSSKKKGNQPAKFGPEQFWAEMDKANTPQDKETVIRQTVARSVISLLKLDASEGLNEKQNLQEIGLDSLMSVEFKNVLQGTIGGKLSKDVLEDCQTVDEYTMRISKAFG